MRTSSTEQFFRYLKFAKTDEKTIDKTLND
jgi:hypothetical protein